MTAPVEPTPGAPATEPTPQTAPAQPAVTPEPAKPDKPAEDLASLPDWAQKVIRDARAEAASTRTTAKQTAAEQARTELTAQIAKALGLDGDEPPDPEELTAQIEQAQAAAWRSGVELQVFRGASALGADPAKLLDSLSFIDSLDDLVDVDPGTPDFAAQLQAKISAAIERNPTFKADQAPAAAAPSTPRPDPSQGTRGAIAAARPTSLFDAISKAVGPKT